MIKKTKKRSYKNIMKSADKYFSLYIRNRDRYQCFTCGSGDRNKMQCGHLITRGNHAVRYDQENCFCQCQPCNFKHEYDPSVMEYHYVQNFGWDRFQALKERSFSRDKLTREKLEEIEEKYKKLIGGV